MSLPHQVGLPFAEFFRQIVMSIHFWAEFFFAKYQWETNWSIFVYLAYLSNIAVPNLIYYLLYLSTKKQSAWLAADPQNFNGVELARTSEPYVKSHKCQWLKSYTSWNKNKFLSVLPWCPSLAKHRVKNDKQQISKK